MVHNLYLALKHFNRLDCLYCFLFYIWFLIRDCMFFLSNILQSRYILFLHNIIANLQLTNFPLQLLNPTFLLLLFQNLNIFPQNLILNLHISQNFLHLGVGMPNLTVSLTHFIQHNINMINFILILMYLFSNYTIMLSITMH